MVDQDIKIKSFFDVKQALDPSRSYIIFKNDLAQDPDTILSGQEPVYALLESNALQWSKIFDEQQNCEYLIVETDPGQETTCLGRLLTCPLPEKVIYYVYKAG